MTSGFTVNRGVEDPGRCARMLDADTQCPNRAEWTLKAAAWAKGHPKGSHEPMEIQIGLAFCEGCRGASLAEFESTAERKRLGKVLIAAARAIGRVDPDWRTMEYHVVPWAPNPESN